MQIFVGLDLGASRIKVSSKYNDKLNEFILPSNIRDGYDEYTQESKLKVVHNNSVYSVGVGKSLINERKYFSDDYKILFLTALTKVSQDSTLEEFNVVISLPADLYRNEELKKKIKDNVKSWGNSKIYVDGKEYNIKINNFDIWIEAGIIISHYDYYADKKVIIVDIGGFTWDILEIVENKKKSYLTNPKGILTLKETIFREFKKDYDVHLNSDSVNSLFECIKENKPFNLKGNYINLEKYHKIVQSYVDEIFNQLAIKFPNTDYEIIFIGGGTLDLKSFLNLYRDTYDFSILDEPNMLNARANYDYSKFVFGKEESLTS